MDTDRCDTAELLHARHRPARARHRRQAVILVADGEDGIADLGEGTVAEDTVDAETGRHADDFLQGRSACRRTVVSRLRVSLACVPVPRTSSR